MNFNKLGCPFLKFLIFKCLTWERRGEKITFYPKVHYKNMFFTKKMFTIISVSLTWAGASNGHWTSDHWPVCLRWFCTALM